MSLSSPLTIQSDSPRRTKAIGRCLAAALRAGDLIALEGDLGAGKTCFVQGLAEGLGVGGRVASPTFIVMRAHPGPLPLFHADAYRLACEAELLDLGLEDWLEEGVVAVEWANQTEAALPADHLTIRLAGSGDERALTFIAHGSRSRQLLEHISQCAC